LRGIGPTATADPAATLVAIVPIYEFDCSECGHRFEELVADAAARPACPQCDSERTARRFSSVAPPGRQPRGAKVRDSEARRREREAQRGERISDARRRRAAT
jgi:putative FmdB family regulatory protein